MKKLFFLLLTLLLIPISCSAAVYGKCGDSAKWTITDAGTLLIYGAPPFYPYFTDWDDERFSTHPWDPYQDRITGITVRDGFSAIPPYFFSGLQNAARVSLPDSIQFIGYGSFEGCSGLASVVIPQGVTNIDMLAFSGCASLASVTLPDSKVFIQSQAFEACPSLRSITIPNTVGFDQSFDPGITILSSACHPSAKEKSLLYGYSWQMTSPHALLFHEGLAATCVQEGYDPYWECALCRALFSDAAAEHRIDAPVILPVTKHAYQISPAVDATCTAEGHTMGIFCGICGDVLVAETVIPMTAHTAVDSPLVPPAETVPGHTAGKVCSVCGKLLEGEPIPALCDLDVLRLPASARQIEAYAFAGIDCQAVLIPSGCESIGEYAFAGCENLQYALIPASVTSCPATAFDGCAPDAVLYFAPADTDPD